MEVDAQAGSLRTSCHPSPPPHQVHRVRLHVCRPGGSAAQGRPQVRLSVTAVPCAAQLAATSTRIPAAGHLLLPRTKLLEIHPPAANLSSRCTCRGGRTEASLVCSPDAERSLSRFCGALCAFSLLSSEALPALFSPAAIPAHPSVCTFSSCCARLPMTSHVCKLIEPHTCCRPEAAVQPVDGRTRR